MRGNYYNRTVFEFKGYFKSDRDSIQYRYVCAYTEEEAEKKMEQYIRKLKKDGFDEFVCIGYPIVHMEGVIA